MNSMKEIKLEKVTFNIGCAEDKEKLARAEKLLAKLTNKKPIITKTHKRNTFGLAKGRPIGVKVTLRGREAEKLLKDVLKSVDNKVRVKQVNEGNFSIGVKEYIDLPNVNYDPEIGIMGFDFTVTLERAGYRVKRRKLRKAKIGKSHIITKQETIEWLKKTGVNVVD